MKIVNDKVNIKDIKEAILKQIINYHHTTIPDFEYDEDLDAQKNPPPAYLQGMYDACAYLFEHFKEYFMLLPEYLDFYEKYYKKSEYDSKEIGRAHV